jgi:hypothetical protein
MAMHDQPTRSDPLAGSEHDQAARFAMTLVTQQGTVCRSLIRIVELGLLEPGELLDDPPQARLPLNKEASLELSDQRTGERLEGPSVEPARRRRPDRARCRTASPTRGCRRPSPNRAVMAGRPVAEAFADVGRVQTGDLLPRESLLILVPDTGDCPQGKPGALRQWSEPVHERGT